MAYGPQYSHRLQHPPASATASHAESQHRLDPDNPERGEYTALTEYQYTMMERWSAENSMLTGLGNRYLFRSKSYLWNKGPMR